MFMHHMKCLCTMFAFVALRMYRKDK